MPYKEQLVTIGIPKSTKESLEEYRSGNNSRSWKHFFETVMEFIDKHAEQRDEP